MRSKGRVVNITSTGGRVAMPAYGAYAGSKFALEAVSDSLRRELASQGVEVIVVNRAASRPTSRSAAPSPRTDSSPP
ncbi:SDR family NAD(P)-dependent oxidoreductase [Streptomyces brasiliensis]|uniref:SDR family NAD(P)-dependent oxidoreductase n=1 Tax=Streptomyces brasiliensis TaxID=1954 RepID=UPI001E4AA9B6|nr:SDR family NAD(P)-dependent oxidoreductase [Streptomyces brasiliensis]